MKKRNIGVIRIRKSKKDRQHNSQKKKDKRTNNDLQNITRQLLYVYLDIVIISRCIIMVGIISRRTFWWKRNGQENFRFIDLLIA
jgi:hypothetical protein